MAKNSYIRRGECEAKHKAIDGNLKEVTENINTIFTNHLPHIIKKLDDVKIKSERRYWHLVIAIIIATLAGAGLRALIDYLPFLLGG